MSDFNTIVPKTDRPMISDPDERTTQDPRQWKLMTGSLLLLLLALGIVLWHDRDFWFPDAPDAESDDSAESSPVAKAEPVLPPTAVAKPARAKHHAASQAKAVVPAPAPATPPPMAATATRTVLPPLEVEVVAGDTHRTIRPGNGSSVHVDLQPGMPAQPVTEAGSADSESAANVTREASEHVQMSAGTSEMVTSTVRPSYPLLARQMKVQGSVILQALIGKDGIIQNLRVVSGPRILASAAQDAVRQWHFKPHIEGKEAVETQAKITVNFTISTN
jgi:protein TonB